MSSFASGIGASGGSGGGGGGGGGISEANSEERRVLEGLRQRFAQLAESTLKLGSLLAGAEVLPEQNALLAAYTVVATHQQAVTEQLARHHDLLAALNVFPLPAFPGSAQEDVLLQLLRKKPEPRVEDWMAGARETFLAHTKIPAEAGGAAAAAAGVEEEGNPEAKMTAQDWHDLWAWAPSVVKTEVAAFRAKLGDADSDEEDDDYDEDGNEDEVMGDDGSPKKDANGNDVINIDEDSKPTTTAKVEPISLSRLLKFYHTGVLPPSEPKNVRPPGRPPA